jgi:hypothetical protein
MSFKKREKHFSVNLGTQQAVQETKWEPKAAPTDDLNF